jgi:hypothetical protein
VTGLGATNALVTGLGATNALVTGLGQRIGAAALALATSSLACGSSGGLPAGVTSKDAEADAAPDAAPTSDAPVSPSDARSEGSLPNNDAGSDAGAKDPLTLLAPCLGASVPIVLSGQMPYDDLPIGTLSGYFVLDFGSTFSSIDLGAFPSPGPMTSGCDPDELGQECTVEDFAFFSSPGSVVLVTEDYSDLSGSVRQAGILGTDFLSEHAVTLGYQAKLVFASPSAGLCSDSDLMAAGLLPLTTAGFYENDLSLLEPLTDVDSNGSAGSSVPNVPTVAVSVAGANAVAQLDTGFDDDVTPFSVNINPAFLVAIQSASTSAVVREPSLDSTLTTCVSGVDETLEAYRLASGTTFDFVADGGTTARSYASTVLFVKNTPSSAASCGGIGTWTVPAAQVGASYYNDMKVLVFDPYGAKVWIPKGG